MPVFTFWKKRKPPTEVGPTIIAMLPIKMLMEDKSPFSDWRAPNTEVATEYQLLFRVTVQAYQLYIYSLLVARKFGSRVATVVRQEQIDRFEVGPKIRTVG